MTGSTLPKTYQLDGLALYVTVGGLVLMGLAFVGAAWWSEDVFPTTTGRWFAVGFGVSMILLAYAGAKEKVVLYQDRIEKSGVFGSYSLGAHEIEGYRNAGKGQQIRLIPRQSGGRAMTVSGAVLQDGAGVSWVDNLKNLDAADLHASEESVLDDPRFGSTRSERAAYLSEHRKWMNWLGWVGWSLFAWGLVWPHPYTVVIAALVLAPPMASAALMWGQVLSELRGDRNAELAAFGMIVVPALALALRALYDVTLIDYLPMLSVAAAASVAFAAVAAWLYPLLRSDALTVFAIGAFGLAYFAGTLSHANVLLDRASATPIETQIRDKHETGGKHNRYELTVGPWGEMKSENDVTVTRRFYNRVNSGDTICVYVSPGRLGWRWYEVDFCRQ